jgi:hypothetical protein
MPASLQPTTSKKRSGRDFAQEVVYKTKRTRRGGQILQAVPAKITPEPTSSSSDAQAHLRASRPPAMHLHEPPCSQELPEHEPITRKRSTGQVRCFLSFMMTITFHNYPAQSSNDVLEQWLPHRDAYLSALLENEGTRSSHCDLCNVAPAQYRCIHCFAHPQLCHGCIISSHKHLPFHFVEKWNGEFFQHTTLQELGFVLHLGHASQPCPANHDPSSPNGLLFCVIDTLGIMQHRIQPCLCQNAAPLHVQLLQMDLFPSTMERPQTVFTFSVLDRYRIESLEGKTSAYSFYNQLRRLTNNYFPHLLPVCSSPPHPAF